MHNFCYFLHLFTPLIIKNKGERKIGSMLSWYFSMMFRLNTSFKNIRKICSPLFIYQICSLREKCPNTEFFWSAFSWIWTRKTPYLDTFHAMATQTKMNLLHFLNYFLNKNLFEMCTNWGSKDRNFIYNWKQISLTILVHDFIYVTSLQRFESGSSAVSIRNFHHKFSFASFM